MAEVRGLSFDVGHRVTYVRTVTSDDVQDLARVSGDTQGFHVDDAYARQSRFGRRIAHGALAIGFVSAALGTLLPARDESVLLVSVNVRAPWPMFIGDAVTTSLEVVKADHRRRMATLAAQCTNQDGEAVLRGQVSIMVDRFPYPG